MDFLNVIDFDRPRICLNDEFEFLGGTIQLPQVARSQNRLDLNIMIAAKESDLIPLDAYCVGRFCLEPQAATIEGLHFACQSITVPENDYIRFGVRGTG